VPNPYAGKVPGSLGAATITEANLLKPYPYMQAVDLSDPRGAHFDGNYLYVSLQRRVEQGFQILGAYTYGKLMSDPIPTDLATVGTITNTGSNSGSGIQNPFNVDGDYSVDAIDVTHRATLSTLYDLPFGKGQRFVSGGGFLDRLVGGFQFNMIMTAESGRPLGITGATNQGIATRPNYAPGVSLKLAHPTAKEWFNTSAFVNPPDYSYGNVPRYIADVRGPATLNFDLSIFKTTHITERTTLELRLEGYNAFNIVNLSQPNTTFVAGPPANPSQPTLEGGTNTSATFGQITSAQSARQVQLGAKLRF
jgi:hypothetical protein